MILKAILISVLSIILFILFAILIPIKIKLEYKTEDESKRNLIDKITSKKVRNNYIRIYLFYFIPMPKIKLEVKKNMKLLYKKSVLKNILNTCYSLAMEFIGIQKINNALLSKKQLKRFNSSIYFEELCIKLGYNFQEVILNAYIMALLNSVFNIILSKNSKMFNLNKIKYDTYISSVIYNFEVYGIVKFNLANTIDIIIKAFIRFRKVEKLDGKRNSSNRRFNDDSYDFT